jgi:hypothetical protein
MRKGGMKKKDRFLLILLGLALCLSFSCCKIQDRYDITGTWQFYVYRDPLGYFENTYKFVGTEMKGQLDFGSTPGVFGEYTVYDDRILFKITAARGIHMNVNEYDGVFITNDLMKGTLKGEHLEMGQVTSTWSGVWNARRVGARARRVMF